jgi:Amt family ammonium transporter
VLTALIGLAIKYTMGWRIKPEAEVEGIDYDQHGESAYDWGTSSGSHVVTKGASS